MDLNECIKKGFIKKTEKNEELVRSLIEMATIRENVVKNTKLDALTISVVVSLAYDSLREVLEALCIMHEYKVLSHICIGELLKNILDDFDYGDFEQF